MKRVWYNIFKRPVTKLVKRILLYVLIKREFNPEAERLNIND